jgi:hypothetical protein
MIISVGEKVHIVTRRFFEDDLRRHFAGIVEEASETAIRVKGFAWVYEQSSGDFIRRKAARTMVFGLADAGLILTVLPGNVDLDTLRYAMDSTRKRVLADDHGFEMNISEFGASR